MRLQISFVSTRVTFIMFSLCFLGLSSFSFGAQKSCRIHFEDLQIVRQASAEEQLSQIKDVVLSMVKEKQTKSGHNYEYADLFENIPVGQGFSFNIYTSKSDNKVIIEYKTNFRTGSGQRFIFDSKKSYWRRMSFDETQPESAEQYAYRRADGSKLELGIQLEADTRALLILQAEGKTKDDYDVSRLQNRINQNFQRYRSLTHFEFGLR